MSLLVKSAMKYQNSFLLIYQCFEIYKLYSYVTLMCDLLKAVDCGTTGTTVNQNTLSRGEYILGVQFNKSYKTTDASEVFNMVIKT